MIEKQVCKNCNNSFTGTYCNDCGQKVYTESDKSLKHVFSEFFHFIFHFEGTLLHTVRTYITKPGKVSLDYCNGIRKPYFKPLSLFLLLVILYLLFPLFEGLNQAMYYYTTHFAYGDFARDRIREVMIKKNINEADLSVIFHQKAAIVSKFLLFILIPVSALILRLLTFRKRRYFFDQMVISAEMNSIFIVVGFLIFPVIYGTIQAIARLVADATFNIGDSGVTIIFIPLFITYFSIAAYRFFKVKKWQAFLLGFIFFTLHNYVAMAIYKFTLFYIVINSV